MNYNVCILNGHAVDAGRSFVGFHTLVGSVQVLPVQYPFKQVCTVRFFGFPIVNAPRSCILFAFRAITLQVALVFKIFCFQHIDHLRPSFGLTIVQPFPRVSFLTPGTMASADFSQFVVTTRSFEYGLLGRACEISPGTHTFFLSIYLPHLLQKIP